MLYFQFNQHLYLALKAVIIVMFSVLSLHASRKRYFTKMLVLAMLVACTIKEVYIIMTEVISNVMFIIACLLLRKIFEQCLLLHVVSYLYMQVIVKTLLNCWQQLEVKTLIMHFAALVNSKLPNNHNFLFLQILAYLSWYRGWFCEDRFIVRPTEHQECQMVKHEIHC